MMNRCTVADLNNRSEMCKTDDVLHVSEIRVTSG